MNSKKCCETVFDIATKRDRKCKLYRHFREYCYIHSRVFFNNAAILVQRIWYGFYIRKKLKNLFYNLPLELQSHVVKYVRTDHYMEKKWIPSVLKIYKNRLFHCHVLKKDLYTLYTNHGLNVIEFQFNMCKIFKKEIYTYRMIDAFTDNWTIFSNFGHIIPRYYVHYF